MTGTKPRSNRRRKVLVDRPFQLKFVSITLLFLSLLTVATLAGIYWAMWATLYTFQVLDDPVTISLFTTAGVVVALELLLLAPFLIWVVILLTHKVAGPLIRINAAIAQMAEGNYNVHLALRKGDAMTELANSINRLAARLHSQKA